MKIVLLGAGAMSPEILWQVKHCLTNKALAEKNGLDPQSIDARNDIVFFDELKEGDQHLGHCLLTDWEELPRLGDDLGMLYGVGNPKVKEIFYQKLDSMGLAGRLLQVNLSADLPSCSDDVRLGMGVFVFFNNHISPNVTLHDSVTVNFNSFIAHDCVIGPFTNISSRATVNGSVRVGSRCHIGSGSIIVNNTTVGDDVYVTVGSVITSDIPDGVRVAGNPARFFKWDK
jgi:sugar O-acyltransferase (sialic acid O-acetyltransferase NeuD family)